MEKIVINNKLHKINIYAWLNNTIETCFKDNKYLQSDIDIDNEFERNVKSKIGN